MIKYLGGFIPENYIVKDFLVVVYDINDSAFYFEAKDVNSIYIICKSWEHKFTTDIMVFWHGKCFRHYYWSELDCKWRI